MDNDIFLVLDMVKNTVCCGYHNNISCFDVKAQFLSYETTTTMTFKLKTDQIMTTYLGQYNFEP